MDIASYIGQRGSVNSSSFTGRLPHRYKYLQIYKYKYKYLQIQIFTLFVVVEQTMQTKEVLTSGYTRVQSGQNGHVLVTPFTHRNVTQNNS